MWKYSFETGDEITIHSEDVDIEIDADLELVVKEDPPNQGAPIGGNLRTQSGTALKELSKLDRRGVHFDIDVESGRNASCTFVDCIADETVDGVSWLCAVVTR